MEFIPVITALYAALMIFMFIALAALVIQLRLKHKVSIGDGGHDDLARRIRMHGNFSESVPFLLLLMLILELSGFMPILLHLFGIIMIASRLSHAYGLHSAEVPMIYRQAGQMGTFGLMTLGALACVVLYITSF